MRTRTVAELMVPLDEYPKVSQDATLLEAVRVLVEAQSQLPAGRSPYRAVLVIDAGGRVVGKLGQLSLLKALEPRYDLLGGDLDRLTAAGLSSEFVSSMMEQWSFFKDALDELCVHRRSVRVSTAMQRATESIDVETPLGQAIHQLVVGHALSLLVTRRGEAVGLLRVAELFDEVARLMTAEG